MSLSPSSKYWLLALANSVGLAGYYLRHDLWSQDHSLQTLTMYLYCAFTMPLVHERIERFCLRQRNVNNV